MAPLPKDSTATEPKVRTSVGKQDAKKDRVISLKEVAKHNTRGDAWVAIHKKVYDVSEFAKQHPGGDIILLAAGLDATIMFESYHVRRVSDALLQKYQIGHLASLERDGVSPDATEALSAGSYYNWEGSFYPTLQKRVVERLKKENRSRRGGLLFKATIILVTFFVSYYFTFLHPFTEGNWIAVLIWSLVYGVAAAQIGLSIQHDGNHGAFHNTPWVNKIAGMGMDLIGASAICWEYQHVVGHHQYTNLETPTDRVLEMRDSKTPEAEPTAEDLAFSQENDPDVFSSFPLIRMHPFDQRSWYHRFQHIYAPFFFAFFTLAKVLSSDVKFYLLGRVGHISMHSRLHSWDERARFVLFKLVNISATIVLPTYLFGYQRTLLALLPAHMIAGEYLATCFIVNHIGELCQFYTGGAALDVPGSDRDAKLVGKVHPRDWAYLQAKATTNWAVGSFFWNHFSGGLNHQLEHHLFPGVAHANYPYIADVVRSTCKEFDVPYIETPTFLGACYHCLKYLHYLGTNDVAVTPSRQKQD